MPTTVREAFRAAGLTPEGVVRWGIVPSLESPGVYIVALTDSLNGLKAALDEPPLDPGAVENWPRVVPGLTLDGRRPDPLELAARVARFWLPDEVILYIGKAASLPSRVGDYYTTPLGARRPHAGGYFIKLLSNLEDLYVHFATCEEPGRAEDAMLGEFCGRVSEATRRILLDPAHPFPFANLEWPPGVRKAHGIRGARERVATAPRRVPGAMAQPSAAERDHSSEPLQSVSPGIRSRGGPYRSQRVTAADLRAGQVRIPVSTLTKSLFPSERTDLMAKLRGRRLAATWDPRVGPDRERSGVLRFREKDILRSLVRPDEVLRVTLRAGELMLA